jgi:hypothetical protein
MIEFILLVLIGSVSGTLLITLKDYTTKLEVQEKCEHKNKITTVDSVVVTCETTTIKCLDCGKTLATKTDCR